MITIHVPLHRFVDGDAFARFGGIGIGCQQFQAARILGIRVGPDFTADAPGLQSGGVDADEVESEGGESEGDSDESGDEMEYN